MLSKKICFTTILYIIFCYIGISVFCFLVNDSPSLLKQDIFSYKIYDALSIFLSFLPSIIVSSFFINCAVYLDKEKNNEIEKKSHNLFRTIIIHTVAISCILFCSQEIIEPLVYKAKSKAEIRHKDYNWYLEKANDAYIQGNCNAAQHYIHAALDINPTSKNALTKKELYAQGSSAIKTQKLYAFPELSEAYNKTIVDIDMSVLELMQKAQTSFNNQEYLDAHYYASMGLEIGKDNNANSSILQTIATESWERISTWSGFKTDEDMRIFEKKRLGYEYLMNGDALQAYYIYLDLYNMNSYDPDIKRYFTIAEQAVQNEYFFIDETHNLIDSKQAKNINFTISSKNGLTYTINIGTLRNIKETGNNLKYLQDYHCSVTNEQGIMLYSVSAPFVKMYAQPLSSFGIDAAQKLGLTENTLIPRLLLTSVDRKNNQLINKTLFSVGDENIARDTMRYLPISVQDFDLIIEASAGPQYTNIASLYKFIPQANKYGFSQKIYSSFFLKKISFPFLIFVICIFLLIQAWHFRLKEGTLFRFYWILLYPMVTLIFAIFSLLIDYGSSLFSLSLTHFALHLQIPLLLMIYVIIIILLSIRFTTIYNKRSTND